MIRLVVGQYRISTGGKQYDVAILDINTSSLFANAWNYLSDGFVYVTTYCTIKSRVWMPCICTMLLMQVQFIYYVTPVIREGTIVSLWLEI